MDTLRGKYFSTLSEMGMNQNVRNGVLPNFNAELHNNIKAFEAGVATMTKAIFERV